MSAKKQQPHDEHDYDGQPGCLTAEEVNRMFRHYWDPTTYWQCGAAGKKAQLQRCPQSQLYSDRHGKCVHYTDWEWTDPKEPPSRPSS